MASAYICDNDGSDKVNFEIDPTPVPLIRYRINKIKRRTCCTRNESGQIVPGEDHHYCGGCPVSGASIDCRIIQMSRSVYLDVVEKLAGACSFQFSPDNGTTLYECTFSNLSGEPEQIEGTELVFWNLRFDILREIEVS